MDRRPTTIVPRSSSRDGTLSRQEDPINSPTVEGETDPARGDNVLGQAGEKPAEDPAISQAHGEVTGLLVRWRDGDRTALEQLIPLVHTELRMLARRSLRGENAGNALQTAELINEAYLKLVNCSRVQWHDRTHFFAIAATLMRRVLVDEARKRQFQKRGGEFTRISFDDAMTVAPERSSELIALDEALHRLAEHSARKSRVVELRYFGGLSIEETAAAMGVSVDVVKREWRTARLWLMQELTAQEAGGNGSRSVGEN